MVVVSLISILSAVALPNFSKFRAKAKQVAAKTELTSVYTFQKAFFVETGSYHPNLAYIGFSPGEFPRGPSGCPEAPPANLIRYYTIGFKGEWSAQSVPDYDELVENRPINCGHPGAQPSGAVVLGDLTTLFSARGVGDVGILGDPPGFYAANWDHAVTHIVPGIGPVFAVEARGIISGGTRIDWWQLNQSKRLVQIQSGI